MASASAEIQKITQNTSGKTEYFIKVCYQGKEWGIRKRYSDFVRFDKYFRRNVNGSFSQILPPKAWFVNKPEHQSQRQRGLQQYLDVLLGTTSADLSLIREFLEVDENLLAISKKQSFRELIDADQLQIVLNELKYALLVIPSTRRSHRPTKIIRTLKPTSLMANFKVSSSPVTAQRKVASSPRHSSKLCLALPSNSFLSTATICAAKELLETLPRSRSVIGPTQNCQSSQSLTKPIGIPVCHFSQSAELMSPIPHTGSFLSSSPKFPLITRSSSIRNDSYDNTSILSSSPLRPRSVSGSTLARRRPSFTRSQFDSGAAMDVLSGLLDSNGDAESVIRFGAVRNLKERFRRHLVEVWSHHEGDIETMLVTLENPVVARLGELDEDGHTMELTEVHSKADVLAVLGAPAHFYSSALPKAPPSTGSRGRGSSPSYVESNSVNGGGVSGGRGSDSVVRSRYSGCSSSSSSSASNSVNASSRRIGYTAANPSPSLAAEESMSVAVISETQEQAQEVTSKHSVRRSSKDTANTLFLIESISSGDSNEIHNMDEIHYRDEIGDMDDMHDMNGATEAGTVPVSDWTGTLMHALTFVLTWAPPVIEIIHHFSPLDPALLVRVNPNRVFPDQQAAGGARQFRYGTGGRRMEVDIVDGTGGIALRLRIPNRRFAQGNKAKLPPDYF